MAYVPRYLYDVFISYASANDATSGLIGGFHAQLTKELKAILAKRDDPFIFFDQTEVRGDEKISDQVLSAARSSAIMVVFHSVAYERSEDWCCREYHEFIADAQQLDGRLHVVSLGDKRVDESELKDLSARHFRSFFYMTADDTALPFDPQHRDQRNEQNLTFQEEVARMAREIAPRLDAMRKEAPVKRIFVASSTSTWDRYRNSIKDWFRQHEFLVLMQSHWGKEMPALEEQSAAMMKHCDAFLGIAEPEVPEDAGWKLGQKQKEIADTLNIPVKLLWLPDDQTISEAERRALTGRAGVRTGNLESFKALVLKSLGDAIVETETHRSPPASQKNGFLLVAASSSDEELIGPLIEFADRNRAGRNVWIDEANDGDWVSSLKRAISNDPTSGVVFADGNCDRQWIEGRMRAFDTMCRDLDPRPKLGYCLFPPEPKQPRRYYRPSGTIQASWSDLKPLEELLA